MSQTLTNTAHAFQPMSIAERTGWQTVAILLALFVPSLFAHALDERLIFGASLWDKPLKFQLSLALHMATLAVLLALLPEPWRSSRTVRWSMLAGAFATLLEIFYIMLQASRGRASHFNVATPAEAMGYYLMGVGAVTLVASAFVIGVVLWRQASPAIGPGLRLGTGLGLTLGAVATLVVGSYLSAGQGHWVGGINSDAQSLPLFGWSTTSGDLRVPHFFATHVMQALPIVGWLADRLLPSALARPTVMAAALIWLALVGATFAQAVAGQPLLGFLTS